MDHATFRALRTATGRALLSEAATLDLSDHGRVRSLERLRRIAPAELAGAALDTVLLRQRARSKFLHADEMFFTRDGLEQSTGEVVARHRARRFVGYDRAIDLGCGIGGDTLALAEVTRVVGVDRDPLRLAMAAENSRVVAPTAKAEFVLADIANGGPVLASAAFTDPSRRSTTGRRTFDARMYQPPLANVLAWRDRFDTLAVKVAPGIADEALTGVDCELEFVAVGDDLKEAVVWLGAVAGSGRRATVLPDGATLSAECDLPSTVAPVGRVLYEPNAAVIRAHLVGLLAAHLDAWLIDPTIAYLSSDEYRVTPFARAWSVDSVMPFSVKAIRQHLRSLGVGTIAVKKRGSPLEPEAFIRMLRLRGDGERTVVLTRQAGRPVALICRGPIRTGDAPLPG